MLELLQAYNHLSLIILAASMLAVLSLRIVTGSTSDQIKLIREFRSSAETTTRNCLAARHADSTWQFQPLKNDDRGRSAKVSPLFTPEIQSCVFIEESDRLIRMLAAITKDSGDLRVACLRLRLKALKQIEAESAHMAAALDFSKARQQAGH